MGSLSLKKKLLISFLIVGLLPVLIVTIVQLNENKKALSLEAKNKLIAVREAKAFQLEKLYETMMGQVSSLSKNLTTLSAINDFTKSFDQVTSDMKREDVQRAKSRLEIFYYNEFGEKFLKENKGVVDKKTKEEKLRNKLENLSDAAILLQDAFISSNPHEMGEKDKLNQLEVKNSYSLFHSRYHETFRSYLKTFGFYDIFLVSVKTNKIVYSVYKELDFATDLEIGPYAQSQLGIAYKNALKQTEADQAYISEMDMYFPSYNDPAQFVSSAVFNSLGEIVGVLIFQIPVEKINQILTGEYKWQTQGLGRSGEAYIIGADKVMRSVSRFLVEDQNKYINEFRQRENDEGKVAYLSNKKTTALASLVDTRGANAVSSGQRGFDIFPDYRGVNVLSAYRPLEIPYLQWSILSEMDEDEALASVKRLEYITLIITLAVSIIIVGFTLFFSTRISAKLNEVAYRLGRSSKTLSKSSEHIFESSQDISEASNQQASSLQETTSSLNEISSMVAKSTDNVEIATDLSQTNQKNVQKGQEIIKDLKTKIQKIHDNSNLLISSVDENSRELEKLKDVIAEIVQKTEVIDDIVFQTKLLSFNASVEAARAGIHGKGFSVVAQEVGALAHMSGNASKEISALLERSKEQVDYTVESGQKKMDDVVKEGRTAIDEGLEALKSFNDILSQIDKSSHQVNLTIRDIYVSAKEQSVGVNEISQAMNQLDSVTQLNTKIAHDSAVRSDELKQQSDDLLTIVKTIELIVRGHTSIDKTFTVDVNEDVHASRRESKLKTKLQKVA